MNVKATVQSTTVELVASTLASKAVRVSPAIKRVSAFIKKERVQDGSNISEQRFVQVTILLVLDSETMSEVSILFFLYINSSYSRVREFQLKMYIVWFPLHRASHLSVP